MTSSELPIQTALLEVLNYLPDTVVFVKDMQASYVYGNRTLLSRLGLASLDDLRGRTASDLFPPQLGEGYTKQDFGVLSGEPLTEQLELHLYPSGQVGWCLTTKRALRNETGEVTGLVGLSRDLKLPPTHRDELGEVMTYLQQHYAQPLTIQALADRAQMSLSTFERQVRRIYGVTPTQFLIRTRLEAATRLLRETDWPITQVALECGYFDHSAFSRVFRATVGLSPSAYRTFAQQA